jgi:hypothetical protein
MNRIELETTEDARRICRELATTGAYTSNHDSEAA